MRILIYVALLSSLSCIAMISKHDFFLSIADVHVKHDTLQIAIKLFTHDIEEELKITEGRPIFLDNTSDMDKSFRSIRNYCEPRFTTSGASKKYPVKWIGHEYEEDVCWVYGYSIMDVDSKMVFIQNTLLNSQHHEQHNMVHLTQNGETESQIATRGKTELRFLLK